jgi:hypothetical protein
MIPHRLIVLDSYLPVYHRRFSVTPKEKEDLHRTVNVDLDTVLRTKAQRTFKNDRKDRYKKICRRADVYRTFLLC